MKIKKCIYNSIASVMLVGAITASANAQTDTSISNQTLPNAFIQEFSGSNNNDLLTSSAVEISKLSEQGKIKSSQLIVKFKNNTAPSYSFGALANFSVENIKDFYTPKNVLAASKELFSKLKVISFSQGTNLGKVFKDLMKDPEVEYVAPNYIFELQATTPNDLDSALWGLNNTGQTRSHTDPDGNQFNETGTVDADIDAPEAWDIRHDANNTIIAIIDTGIDYNHSELASNMWTNPGEIAGNGIDDDGNGYIDDVHGYDFADNDNDPMDVSGHGTHCSGTIAAQGDNGNNITGIAWNTKLMALKIFGDESSGAFTSDIVDAILYAADNGAKVSNNSYGANFPNSVLAGIVEKPIYDAINAANDAGMLFVAAAGNESRNLDDHWMSTPSDLELPNIISVAGSNQFDEPASWFTNYGKTSVDIAAPGEFIYSTYPGNTFTTIHGTSMAAPHVTGAAALLREENPNLNPAEIKAILMNTVDRIDALSEVSASGGRLNLFNALSAVKGQGGECESYTSTNDSHVSASRATKEVTGQTCIGTFCFGGTTTYKAVGTEESLGPYGFTTTTLYENQAGVFSKNDNCQMSGDIDAPPVLTLNGDREKFIMVGSDYSLPAIPVTAYDREDGDISESITTAGSFDAQTPGRYIITHSVTDSAGNKAASVSRYIHVTDKDDPPYIGLLGPQCNMSFCLPIKMETGTQYQEPGYIAYDIVDGDLSDQVFTAGDSMENTSEEGIRFLYYSVLDSTGNQGYTSSYRTIAVLDPEMPHIWVRPLEKRSLYEFNSYSYDHYTWRRSEGDSTYVNPQFAVFDLKTEFTDSEQVNWDEAVTVTGSDEVDLTVVGDYVITFSATDPDGNTTTAQQTIHVVEDTEPPVITLFGDSEITVEIGDKFVEPNGSLYDELDRYPTATKKIYNEAGEEISNPFYTYLTEEAVYTVEYLGEDSAGNQATPQYRTVNVVRSHSNHPPRFIYPYGYKQPIDTEIFGSTIDVDGDFERIEIEFNEDGNWITIAETLEWSYKPDWYGERTFRIRAVDANGNMTYLYNDARALKSVAKVIIESRSFQVDGSSITISGTASDLENDIQEISISIDDGEWISCTGTTTWTCPTIEGLSIGQHYFKVRGKDKWYYYVDGSASQFTIEPAIPQIDSYDYSFDGDSLVVTGTASDADGDLSEVHLLVGLGGFQCTGTTSFSCVMPDLVDGTTYDVALQARDSYGNESTPLEFSFTFENPVGECITDTNYNHVAAGRAYQGGLSNLYAYAVGSDDDLGLYGSQYYSTTTSLEETSNGVWTKVASCN
ncbi:MAG: DUF5011 domain-containing protein [Gammaproteobacteria bacterium]|nr:MAG: DUF5011 domain-containing protein [Gammaproteobacteria bacterium]